MNPTPDLRRRRAYWLKTLHKWHWISSAICFVGLVLFAVTGFTLNHAAGIEAKPRIASRTARIDDGLRERLTQLSPAAKARKGRAELPAELQAWVERELSVPTAGREAEWSDDEIYLSLPRPGGDAWLRLALSDGEVEYERTDRGWLAYLNDLHKGRHTGAAWSWFIDLFAAATLVFSVTGLFILKMHAGNRPLTWPMVGMGFVIPALLTLLFIH
jgi:hypothetical protein